MPAAGYDHPFRFEAYVLKQGGWSGCRLLVALVSVALTSQSAHGQLLIPQDIDGSGGYLTAGVGVLNIKRGTGLTVPVGATFFARRFRLIARVSAVDLGLFEKTDPASRYQRSPFGGCIDVELGFRVSEFRCSGGTEVIRAAAVDVSFVPADKIIVARKQGRLYTGMGLRLRHPRTPYGTLGLFFATNDGRANGVRIAIGSNFITLGMSWSLGVGNLLRRL